MADFRGRARSSNVEDRRHLPSVFKVHPTRTSHLGVGDVDRMRAFVDSKWERILDKEAASDPLAAMRVPVVPAPYGRFPDSGKIDAYDAPRPKTNFTPASSQPQPSLEWMRSTVGSHNPVAQLRGADRLLSGSGSSSDLRGNPGTDTSPPEARAFLDSI